jgi:hypothetical protein
MATHTRPYYQQQTKNEAPPNYPLETKSDSYFAGLVTNTYQDRREEFIAHAMRNPSQPDSRTKWFELIRMVGGEQAHEGYLYHSLNFINDRKDCSDFVAHSILRLVYQFDPARREETPNGKVLQLDHPPSQNLLAAAKETLLNFKYWPDEPGIDSMCTWTENHYILFSSAAYLAGQLYKDEVFVNTGETGREKMERNRPRILRWLEMRFKTGFNEWLSHVYYEEDLAALLSLHDFCEDDEIRQKSAMVIDLILLDMVLNQYRGVFGSTHGRSYEGQKKWVEREDTIDTMMLLFGRGLFTISGNMSSPCFALSNYEVPSVLQEIFQDDVVTYVNRQKAGFLVQDQEKWGWDYESLEDGMIFYTNEGYLHPSTAATTIKMFDAFNWWENEFFFEFKPFQNLLKALRALKLTKPFASLLERDICRNMRDEPDIYTYKTPDYMLSTAQDHRKGFGGDQHHIWQATLGPNAVCFTTHPGRIGEATPNYWEGSGLLPRAVQVKNLSICIYKLEKLFPALYVPIRNFYTHAWLPKDQFDEVVEEPAQSPSKGSWIFARKNDGYLALYSQQPFFWHEEGFEIEGYNIPQNTDDYDREVIAPGKQNIWICQLGRIAEDGAFEEFRQSILEAKLSTDGMSVEFHSPGNGIVKFGWEGPLTLNGEIVELENYPRYDNPYVQAPFDSTEIHIKANNRELYLNWETGERCIQ